jgi:hypothetical protein
VPLTLIALHAYLKNSYLPTYCFLQKNSKNPKTLQNFKKIQKRLNNSLKKYMGSEMGILGRH